MSPHPITSHTSTARTPRPGGRSRAARAAVLGVALVAGVLTACGDDDEAGDTPDAAATTSIATADAPDTPDTPDSTGVPGGGDLDGACDDYATITGGFLTGQADPAGAPDVLDHFVANAPAEIADSAAVIRDGLTALFAGDEGVFADPDFGAALSDAGDHLFSVCPTTASAEVAAGDYRFDGLPAEIEAGRFAVRFINTSTAGEPHELILLRRPDGDDTAVDELIHLPMEQLMADYQMAGVVFSDAAGVANTAFFDLEAGSYVAICTIPVLGDEASSHAMAGMTAELEVTA